MYLVIIQLNIVEISTVIPIIITAQINSDRGYYYRFYVVQLPHHLLKRLRTIYAIVDVYFVIDLISLKKKLNIMYILLLNLFHHKKTFQRINEKAENHLKLPLNDRPSSRALVKKRIFEETFSENLLHYQVQFIKSLTN